MRNLILALVVMVLFACLLVGIVQNPKSENAPPNSTPETEISEAGRKLVEHLQGVFEEFENFTLSLENAATTGNNHFILTLLGVVKLACLMVVLGIMPAAGVVTTQTRRKRDR
jgi:hypothetical protein